jgi:CheY-like chemotaxis protein
MRIKQLKKILVIEDDPAYLKLIKDQLTAKYSVIEAANGQEGLTIAKLQHPDLILLDIQMPGICGMTMLEELRKDSYGKSAKVVILTNTEPKDKIIKRALEGQPMFYLRKCDTQLSKLVAMIKELLAS